MAAFWQAKNRSKDEEKLTKNSNRSHPDVHALRCGPMSYDRNLSQHPDDTDMRHPAAAAVAQTIRRPNYLSRTR
jgi:hypothetical protein